VQHFGQSFGVISQRVTLKTQIDAIHLGIETAIPLGLIVTELISNAYKHAYPGGRSGEIMLRLNRFTGEEIEIEVADDGVGLPEGFDIHKVKSLGMQLVVSLSQQLDADLRYESDRGTRVVLRFVPDDNEARRLATAV
jgi:two-component sensor histidine kinase